MTDQCNRGCALEGFIESLIRKVAEVHMSRSFEFFDNQFKWQVQGCGPENTTYIVEALADDFTGGFRTLPARPVLETRSRVILVKSMLS
jgi:hypothetical protein